MTMGVELTLCPHCRAGMTYSSHSKAWYCVNELCGVYGLLRVTGWYKSERIVAKIRKRYEVELSRIDDTPDKVVENRKRAADSKKTLDLLYKKIVKAEHEQD